MGTAVLRADGLARSFGQVTALDGADFEAVAGEVTALIGDNGAGKSTLVEVLTGNLAPDAGVIAFEGRPVVLDSPGDARRLGIEVVHQDLALAPHLGPAQNMFLGREVPARGLLGRLGFLDDRAMREQARAGLADLGGTVTDLNAPVGSMSGGQRQQVAIARAIAWASRVLFLDEPTAALGVVQTRHVLDSIRRCRDRGIAVVLISHSMPEVLEIADRIQVLRLGRRVATYRGGETDVEQLVGAMTGAIG